MLRAALAERAASTEYGELAGGAVQAERVALGTV